MDELPTDICPKYKSQCRTGVRRKREREKESKIRKCEKNTDTIIIIAKTCETQRDYSIHKCTCTDT